MDLATARYQMIGQQLRTWGVLDERVLEAIEAVPRERFLPPGWRQLAYADMEIPLGEGRELAPPKIQGRALQAVLPQPGDHALEVACGTGYLTACLARLAAQVTAMESDPVLAAAARANLAALGAGNAEVLEGDALATEFPQHFDVICVNGSLPGASERLEQLLAVGGRLFVVTGRAPVMHAMQVTRTGESEWRRESVFETCLPPLDEARRPAEFVF
jgi:protein-L-isoaspartate(D-aspartate) O-methyltransferase